MKKKAPKSEIYSTLNDLQIEIRNQFKFIFLKFTYIDTNKLLIYNIQYNKPEH